MSPIPARIRIIKYEAVHLSGRFEVRFPDGRPSQYFYWDDIPGRRLRPDRARRPSTWGMGNGRWWGLCAPGLELEHFHPAHAASQVKRPPQQMPEALALPRIL